MAPTIPAMPPQTKPKTMSNRLMTMKFMQRGAAVSSSEASSPATPKSDEKRGSSKKRKLSHRSTKEPQELMYDEKAVQAAVDEQERKRQAAIKKRALELGDAHWVLDSQLPALEPSQRTTLNIVQVGFAQIDSIEASNGEKVTAAGPSSIAAHSSFRRYNMQKHTKLKDNDKDKDQDSGASSSSDSDDDSHSDNETGRSSSPASRSRNDRGRPEDAASAKTTRRRSSVFSKRSNKQAKAQQLAAERRKKEVQLNKPVSISSAGASSPKQRPPRTTTTCFICGSAGHKASACRNRHL